MTIGTKSELARFLLQLKAWLESISRASKEGQLSPKDLESTLSFISKVVEVVSQAFEDLQRLLISIINLEPQELLKEKRTFVAIISDYKVRSRWSKGEQLCARLKSLSEQYERIEPVCSQLQNKEEWNEIYWLIQEHEGRIVRMMEHLVSNLESDLEAAESDADVLKLQSQYKQELSELKTQLKKLNSLHNDILGLSGRDGLLELIRTPDEFAEAIGSTIYNLTFHKEKSVVVDQSMHIGGNVTNSKISLTAAENITDSFNNIQGAEQKVDNALKQALSDLNSLVQESLPKLEEEAQEKAASRANSLIKEALQAKPDADFLQVSAKGLIEAAKTVSEIGEPIIKAVKTILQLFGIAIP